MAARDSLELKVLSLGHTGPIYAVAWSPAGRRALSGSADKTVRLWDVETLICVRVLEGHSGRILSVSWSRDGRHALSGATDHRLRLWDVETGSCLRVLEGHSDSVWSVCLSADGRRAVSGSADKTLRLWDMKTGRCLRVLEGHSGPVWSVYFSPDGKRALTGAADHTIRLWDVETGICVRVLEGHFGSVWSVRFSPDGKRALSGAEDNTVRLWDLETGTCVRMLEGHSDEVLSVSWSPDGLLALSGAADHTVRLWDVETGICVRVLEVDFNQVLSISWSSDGQRVLGGSFDNTLRLWDVETGICVRVLEGNSDTIWSVSLSADGRSVLSETYDNTVRLWDVGTGICVRVLEGHSNSVTSVSWDPGGRRALSGAADHTVRLWDVETGICVRVLEGHSGSVMSVAWRPDGRRALSGAADYTVRLWDVETGICVRVLEGHSDSVMSVTLSADGRRVLSGASDHSVRLWDVETGICARVLEGHSGSVTSVSWSADGRRALSGSNDKTVRLWDVETGICVRVLEGHSNWVKSVSWSPDGLRALSGSNDKTVRLWDVETGICVRVLEGHSDSILSVSWSPDGQRAFSTAANGVMRVWDVSDSALEILGTAPPFSEVAQVQYTNAKVLLVGDSGVGKTGLAKYLALGVQDEERNASTDGAWATHWVIPQTQKEAGVDREIWLWDFAGQVDYRLVHQLYMEDTAAAVLVFNPQNENPFEGLGQWDRDLQKAARKPFAKLLVAGRVDRGGLVVSDASMQKFMVERGFRSPLYLTSAKTGDGCDTLRDAIVEAIDWNRLPVTTSLALYHRMKEEVLRLRDTGMILIRLSELSQRLELLLRDQPFTLAQLQTALGHLAGPGMIQLLEFGGFVLLQPEVISRYAAALVRKVRKHPQEMGCISEDELLVGNLDYQDFKRLPAEDESVVLRALHQVAVSRAWCLRQPADGTILLTFPSYFRRERPPQPEHPRELVTYRFTGMVDEIYATLVVRLHHTVAFACTDLWKDAADFNTQVGAALGLTLTRESEGTSRLDAYFAQDVDEMSKLLFQLYIHNHLGEHARDRVRLRHYCCGAKKCGRPFLDRAAIDEALSSGGKGKVFCPACGRPVLLRDAMEQKFESPEVREEARQMQVEGQIVLDNESRELLAVHHAGLIVAEAGQIYRGYTNSDKGIDGEIEFKDDAGHATGKRLYLQLKSGDSYLTVRQRDREEIFRIKEDRWADYWQQQAYPVMLVIRTSDGTIRWMDVSEWLRRNTAGEKKPKQIVFQGEPFDAASVRRWRERMLGRK